MSAKHIHFSESWGGFQCTYIGHTVLVLSVGKQFISPFFLVLFALLEEFLFPLLMVIGFYFILYFKLMLKVVSKHLGEAA